jgi:hypothetical protein
MLGRNGFLARRWRGEVSTNLVLWRDMLGVGSLLNISFSLLALVLAAQGLPLGVAVALHFAPVPYNLFLFLVVWRAPARTALQGLLAALWLPAMLVL